MPLTSQRRSTIDIELNDEGYWPLTSRRRSLSANDIQLSLPVEAVDKVEVVVDEPAERGREEALENDHSTVTDVESTPPAPRV